MENLLLRLPPRLDHNGLGNSNHRCHGCAARSIFAGPREDPSSTLLAVEQIKLLKSRYFQAVDEDYASIAALFTAGAVVDLSGEPQYHTGHHGVTDGDVDAGSWRVRG